MQTTPSVSPAVLWATLPPLSYLLLADRLGELYEMVFPDQPDWLDGEVVDWADEDKVVAAAERFLGRVSVLFPVHEEFWEPDIDAAEWRLHEIPVMPMGYDEWDGEWEDLKEPAPYLLHLCYSRDDEGRPPSRDEFAELYPDYLLPRGLQPHSLIVTLRQIFTERHCTITSQQPLPGLPPELIPEPPSDPLVALPDLIEMLIHSTGNSWLDVGEIALAEGGGYPQWNREEVEWLTEEWQKAQPVLDKVNQLLDWQERAPAEIEVKLTAVRDVLLEAYHRAQQAAQQAVTATT